MIGQARGQARGQAMPRVLHLRRRLLGEAVIGAAAVRARPIALTALAAMIGGFFILEGPCRITARLLDNGAVAMVSPTDL